MLNNSYLFHFAPKFMEICSVSYFVFVSSWNAVAGAPSNSHGTDEHLLSSALARIQSALHCLPTDSLQQLEKLGRVVNAHGLLDSIKSRLEVAESKWHQLDHQEEGRRGGETLVPGAVNWVLGQEKEQVRRWALLSNQYLKLISEWIEKQENILHLSTSATKAGESVDDGQLSITREILPMLWRIGPVALWRLEQLGQFVNQDNLVLESILPRVESLSEKTPTLWEK